MPQVSTGSITSVRISLRVDGEPHLLIMLDAGGHVKRMGFSALSKYEDVVATGAEAGLFEEFTGSVPQGLLARAGVYRDPGTEGARCEWRIEFEGETGAARFDLTYCAGSAGLPPAMAALVDRAERLTDSWYGEHLALEEAPSFAPPPREPVGATAMPTPPVSGAGSTWTIGEYLSFKGRIGRADYLVQYVLPLMALSFAGGFADGVVGLATPEGIGPMGAAATLLTLWPSMAGWAKRLHDFDTSLWVVPGVMFGGGLLLAVGLMLSPVLGIAAGAVLVLAVVALFLATYCLPGTKGPNRYGPEVAIARG